MNPGRHGMRILAAFLGGLLALATTLAQAAKPERVALVIGNGAYPGAPLANPVHDADDVAKTLAAAGFVVVRRTDASLREMHLALREFGDRLTRDGTALFYYAGHGVQVRGRNYLIPVDADIAREDEVAYAALDLAAVLDKMDTARSPVSLVILDACRNNPFAKRFQVSAPGLAEVDAPPGTLIAFATAPGSLAVDGSGRNGLYTQHLLRHMGEPGVPVEDLFKRVRTGVRQASRGVQVPWESTSLETAFTFVAAPPNRAAATSAPEPPRLAAATPTSIGAPPRFVIGDRWRFRGHDLIAGTERDFSVEIQDIRGDEVRFRNGATADLLGNPVTSFRGEQASAFRPSARFYVFPLAPGEVRRALPFEQVTGKRHYDGTVTLNVIGEEDVVTPAGRIRAIRIERVAEWTRRGGAEAGTNTWTYWYNAAIKRWVLAETRNVTREGKLLRHERFELLSYALR